MDTYGIIYSIQGQQSPDTITIEKKQVSRFYYQGKKMKPSNMLVLMKPNKEAYREMVIAKRKHDTAGLFGFVGGFIIGWQFISTIQEKSSPWEVTAIGVASIIASIPFNSSYSRHAVNAAKLYNGGLKDTSLEYEKLELGITGTGIGLQLIF